MELFIYGLISESCAVKQKTSNVSCSTQFLCLQTLANELPNEFLNIVDDNDANVQSRHVVLCHLRLAWVKNKVENVIKSFLKCGISNVIDGTKDDILYNSDVGVEVDSPEPDWNPYNEDIRDKSYMCRKRLETDCNDCEEFDRF
ncbi:Hypothetical predicted protein [Octopus vulgaris]|uniref:Uncharacterized protein n=1 Tax=Octopus vulgaris TaxID=6645 RepID=A0AA36BKU5_OCTVU|nr:Hypothetical predicted protein [Octopus vulgaris]